MTYRVAILLSAYGDCEFLHLQIRSIVEQMGSDDILVVVDDGSGLVQWNAISRWPKNYLIWTRLRRIGSSRSFIDVILNAEVSASYFMLSDQDDIWLPGKIDAQINTTAMPCSGPHANCHAWKECSGSLEPAHQSLVTVVQPLACLSPAHYCFETPAPGMTLAFNNSCREFFQLHRDILISLSPHLPHDRILFALISANINLLNLSTAYVLYRQHANNLIGAPRRARWGFFNIFDLHSKANWNTFVFGFELFKLLNKSREPATEKFRHMYKMRLRSHALDDFLLRVAVGLRELYFRLFHQRRSTVLARTD